MLYFVFRFVHFVNLCNVLCYNYLFLAVLKTLDELVEGPLLNLSTSFPLVSFSVWKIHAELTAHKVHDTQ